MPVTMKQVRASLDPEEPNYVEASKLGTEAIPHLETLVRGNEPMLASKAAYLASLLLSEGSERVVQAAAMSTEPIVRVAAAAAARNLSAGATERVLSTLNQDPDAGVQKVAARALDDDETSTGSAKATAKNRRSKATGPEPSLPGEGGGSIDGSPVTGASRAAAAGDPDGPTGEGGGSVGGDADRAPATQPADDGGQGSGGGSIDGVSRVTDGEGGDGEAEHKHDAVPSRMPAAMPSDVPRLFGGGQY